MLAHGVHSLRCAHASRVAQVRPSGLDTTANGGAPDTWSRGAQYRARKAQCRKMGLWGRLVETMHLRMDNDDDIDVAIQNPLAMLDAVAPESVYFSKLLADTYARQPCTKDIPWTIVLYLSAYVGGPTTRLCGERRSHPTQPPHFRITQYMRRAKHTSRQCAPTLWPAVQDGVNPSDAISKTHSRKSAVFYWTILEWHTASRPPPTLVANDVMRATLARSVDRSLVVVSVVVVAHGAPPLW